MHFYVSMNIFGLMNVLVNSNLHTTENMLMTYLFCFVHQIILKNSKTIWILNIETSDSSVRKNNNSMPFSGRFNYQNQQWFQIICVSHTHIQWSIFQFQQFHFQRIWSWFDFHFIILNIFNCFGLFNISFRTGSFKGNLQKGSISSKIDR